MSLRKIDESIVVPNLADFQVAREWHSIHCTLETPLQGGGVKKGKTDQDMPIRVTEIRGQLRFWWRLLAQQYQNQENNEIWKFLDGSDLRKQEFALWGGMSDGEEGGKASLVFLRVKADLPYRTKGFAWDLEYAFDTITTDQQKQQFDETLRWFVTLGGIGGRTRRGCGVFSADGVKLVSEQEMEKLGCQILFSGSLKDVDFARKDAIQQWNQKKSECQSKLKTIVKQNSRHLVTVFSRPVQEGTKWRGMIILLPNSSQEIQQILGRKQS